MNHCTAADPELTRKYESLKQYFKTYAADGICIAYSGGVDSTLLLKTAVCALSEDADRSHCSLPEAISVERSNPATDTELFLTAYRGGSHLPAEVRPVLAVILETQLHPHSDTEQAVQMAQSLGARPIVLNIDEFQNKELLYNPVNRCYLCKHMLFSRLVEQAHALGYCAVFDGTNKDDEREYRPGRRVLQELQIKSPLLLHGITKAEVRSISAQLGLSTASVPSTPCLATRLPYGAFLDQTILANIHTGETLLRQMGFYNVRLRYHEPVLRLEVDCSDFAHILEHREAILPRLRALGFPYITLDLEGFRSGSMDMGLNPDQI